MKPARTAAEIEADLAIISRHREAFDRLLKQRRTKEEEDLDRELLLAISKERMDLEERMKPPPAARVFPDALRMTREQAAAKAAELMRIPAYFKGPGTRDAVGKPMLPWEHELLVKTVAELRERADGPDPGTGAEGA